jgi:NIPSNAP protein
MLTLAPTPALPAVCCPVVELRQYTLRPGQREALIALFDREFVESQEATGMQLIAQFRDIDRPDVFTWLRGFPDMPARAASLGAFYGGPVWAAHQAAANATMVSSDNVRLLRPAGSGTGFELGERPAPGAAAAAHGLIVATIYTLTAAAAPGFKQAFERVMVPELMASGVRPFAVFETEPAPNTFPRLPVREGEHAFVWFARFADLAEYDRWKAKLDGSNRWREAVRPLLERSLQAPVEVWRLVPTARSRSIGVLQAVQQRDGQHDFDFEIGTWKTHLKRLRKPLTGSSTWVEYVGSTVVTKVWNGRANLVELEVDGPQGHLEGLSLRLYNPEARQWSLNFSNSAGGTLSPPAIGEFRDGRGEFYSQETLNGRAILVRFVISDITPTSARFEQAFSADGGKTWEVNWIAVDTRVP